MLITTKAFNEAELTLEDLKTAMSENQLRLKYQPIVRLHDNQIVQAEALVRWQHPIYGELTPDKFLPFCEESGLIHALGRWVLHTAAQQLKDWHAQGYSALSMAVNLSANQLNDPNFLSSIINLLSAHEIHPQYLQLEITEQFPIQNFEQKRTLFKSLQALGLQLSLDDFGMGYASLNHLKQLAFNILKIDKAFIADLSTNSVSQAIVESVITLGKKLGLTIIAEGVESAEQLAILKRLHCDMVQGFLYSQPIVAEKFQELITCH